MAGLLDDDGSLESAGFLRGLLGASQQRKRPFTMLLGGLAGMQQAQAQAAQRTQQQAMAERRLAIEEELKRAQIQEIAAQIEQRKAGMEKQQRLEDMGSRLIGGSIVGNGAPGSGLSLGGVREQPRAPGIEGARLSDVAALRLAGGPDLHDLWKTGQTGVKQEGGSNYVLNGRSTYVPTLDKNMTMEGGRVAPVPGSLETIAALTGAQADAQQRAAARYALTPPDVSTGRPTTIEAFVQTLTPQAGQMPAGLTPINGRVPTNEAQAGEDLKAFTDRVIANRTNMGGSPAGGLKTALTPRDKWHYDAARGVMVNEEGGSRKVTDEEGKNLGAPKDAEGKKRNDQFLTAVTQARRILESGSPTESFVGTAIDKVAGGVGYTAPGAESAAKLATISGWLTSNVPRMEGPQSNYDIENYKVMAARVGDSTLPVKVRLAALSSAEDLIRRYADLQGQASKSPIVRTGRRADGTRVVQRADGSIDDGN